MSDLSAPLKVALDAVAQARELLLAECARPDGPRGEIGACPADLEAEKLIRDQLLDAFPSWGYLGEETAERAPSDGETRVWIVDPNDGTSSMQRGYRGHAVSVALVRDARPVLGVVCAVDAPDDAGDLFAWAEGCGPLRRNGMVVEPLTWRDALSASDVVAASQAANRNPAGYAACLSPARFVGLPSIAYRLALLAVGECAATLSLNYLSVWDYAAGHALVRAAGGVLVGEVGDDVTYAWSDRHLRRRVFAGSPGVVRQLCGQPWERVGGSGFGDGSSTQSAAPLRARNGAAVHDAGVLRRAQGCLLGELAGESLGARSTGTWNLLEGQPTGASELALRLARSLVARGGFDVEAVAIEYEAWFHGRTHTDEPRECGHAWCKPFDVNARRRASAVLVRACPLGIWGAMREPFEVANAARLDAQLTDANQVTRDAAALFAVTLAAAIRNGLDPLQTHRFALDSGESANVATSLVDALRSARTDPPHDYISQTDSVLVAFGNAFFQLLHAANVEEALIDTARAGGDADANSAVCGSLLGAVHGRDAIPLGWRQMTLTARAIPGKADVEQPRPVMYWPTDALIVAERLLTAAQ